MDDDVLKQAIGLIIEGNKKSASELLAGVVRTEPTNEMAWLYLSYCVDPPDQKAYCLKKTIEINPSNQQAKQALSQMGVGGQAPKETNVSPQQPSVQSQISQQKISAHPARMKKCPYCAEDILEGAVVCRYCGRGLTKSRNPRPIANGFDILSLAATLILGIAVFFLPIWPGAADDITMMMVSSGMTLEEMEATTFSEYLLGQLQSDPIHVLIIFYTRFLIPIVAIASIILIIITFFNSRQGKHTSGIWLIILGMVLMIRPLIPLTTDEAYGSITSPWVILVLAIASIFIIAGFGKIFMGESPSNR